MNTAEAHNRVAEQVHASGTSFYWPMNLQRAPQRQALYAIYAFCRVLDDIADREGSTESKQGDLNSWRDTVDRIYTQGVYDEACADFLVVALSNVIQRFNLARAPFDALIDGMEADINGPIVAPGHADLKRYCDQVAGSVGDLCLAVWGWRGSVADQFAYATGEALQLTILGVLENPNMKT